MKKLLYIPAILLIFGLAVSCESMKIDPVDQEKDNKGGEPMKTFNLPDIENEADYPVIYQLLT